MAVYTKIQVSDLKDILLPYEIDAIDFNTIEGGNANSSYQIKAKQGDYILTIADTFINDSKNLFYKYQFYLQPSLIINSNMTKSRLE